MPFITLHAPGSGQNEEVVINSDHIIEMRRTPDYTRIFTLGASERSPHMIAVVEPLQVVLDTIEEERLLSKQ